MIDAPHVGSVPCSPQILRFSSEERRQPRPAAVTTAPCLFGQIHGQSHVREHGLKQVCAIACGTTATVARSVRRENLKRLMPFRLSARSRREQENLAGG